MTAMKFNLLRGDGIGCGVGILTSWNAIKEYLERRRLFNKCLNYVVVWIWDDK